MAVNFRSDPGDPGESGARTERIDDAALETKRLVRDGVQMLARGAMICPNCALPISPPARVRPKAEMRCGFCDHSSPAHAFVRGDVVDTAANEIHVVARIV